MILATIAFVLGAFQTAQVPQSLLVPKPNPETVMAKVDGVPIHASDIDRLLWDWHASEVAQDLIAFQLITQQAAKLKVIPSAAEIKKEFDRYIAEQMKKLPAGQDFDTALRQQGLPKSRLFMQFEGNLLLNKIVDANFNPNKFVKASTLIFPPKSEAATDQADAVGKAQDAYNRLLKGEDWEKVLNSSGQDPRLVTAKGLLGWVSLESFPNLTQAEFKTLKLGGYSKPVLTKNGIQLFRLDAAGASATGDDLLKMKSMYEQASKGALLQELQKAAKIEKFFGSAGK